MVIVYKLCTNCDLSAILLENVSPAKGVDWDNRCESSNLSFSAKCAKSA